MEKISQDRKMIGALDPQKTLELEISEFEKLLVEQIRNLQEGQQMILFKRGGKAKVKFTIQIKSETSRFLIFRQSGVDTEKVYDIKK